MKISKRNFLIKTAKGIACFCAFPLNIKAMENNKYSNYKYKKEANYYRKTPRGVLCQLCPHACKISNNTLGLCKTRYAENNKLYTLAFNNPCSVAVDPIEKKPFYHFYPSQNILSIGTAGCNFACLNCQNYEISQTSPVNIQNYDITPQQLIETAKKQNCKMIAYTYNEPIVYFEYMLECAKLAKKEGLKNVIVSAGYINPKPLNELIPYIDAANIDLKSFDNNIYIELNGGTLEPVLNTIKTLKENNIWLEITNLIIPTYTDNLEMIKKMCIWLKDNGLANTPLHFSRFFPAYKLNNVLPTKISTLENAKTIANEVGIKYVYVGNVSDVKSNSTFCQKCNKVLIERNRFLITKNNIENGECKFCSTKISGCF